MEFEDVWSKSIHRILYSLHNFILSYSLNAGQKNIIHIGSQWQDSRDEDVYYTN